MFFAFTMAPLPQPEKEWLGAQWGQAFRSAVAAEQASDPAFCLKDAAFLMGDLHEAQLSRQLSGTETCDPRRIVRLCLARPSFAGHFAAALVDLLGGWPEVLSHGVGRLLLPLFVTPGQARMARASLDTPRSREAEACGSGSLWRSA